MKEEGNLLDKLWETANETANQSTILSMINFEELTNSLKNIGHFYYYVFDYFDSSISNVSDSIEEVHGFDSKSVTFDDIVNTIHPDDLEFVALAEETNLKFINNIIGKENVMSYKSNYSLRCKLKNGDYGLINRQVFVLDADEQGRFTKVLKIHTDISHICKQNSYTISIIGLNGNPSYTNINVSNPTKEVNIFSEREIQVLKLISEGYTTAQISLKLNISDHTVKTHRKNISKKGGCKNISELLIKCISKRLL